MEQIETKIGGQVYKIQIAEKVVYLLFLAERRINPRKYAKADKHSIRRNTFGSVDITSNLIYAFEVVLNENGYSDFTHLLFTDFDIRERRLLYELFREDKTIRFLTLIQQYREVWIEQTIQKLFSVLNKKLEGGTPEKK